MVSIALLLLAAVGTFLIATRSLAAGICAVLGVGYAYGLVRANMPGMASYMLFDVAVAGLYAAQVLRPGPVISRNTQQLTLLWVLLTAWPILLFLLGRWGSDHRACWPPEPISTCCPSFCLDLASTEVISGASRLSSRF